MYYLPSAGRKMNYNTTYNYYPIPLEGIEPTYNRPKIDRLNHSAKVVLLNFNIAIVLCPFLVGGLWGTVGSLSEECIGFEYLKYYTPITFRLGKTITSYWWRSSLSEPTIVLVLLTWKTLTVFGCRAQLYLYSCFYQVESLARSVEVIHRVQLHKWVLRAVRTQLRSLLLRIERLVLPLIHRQVIVVVLVLRGRPFMPNEAPPNVQALLL
jgi:hypothetical protein